MAIDVGFDDGLDLEQEYDTLLIDGDLIVFKAASIFNDDTDGARKAVQRNIRSQIDKLCTQAGVEMYIFFLTTKYNYRNLLTDDYKANRKNLTRPVNLSWAKNWAMKTMEAVFVKGLEADDLISIYAKAMGEEAVIWSLDKDLRQIRGNHLIDNHVVKIGNGCLVEDGNKIRFSGELGFYFQCLIGDRTDNIIGCGKKDPKTGRRKGVGPKKAFQLLDGLKPSQAHGVVCEQYEAVYGDDWKEELEKQANLLYMIQETKGDQIKLWTLDGRDKWLDLKNKFTK